MSAIRRLMCVAQANRRGGPLFPLRSGRRPVRRLGHRGFILISSYLLLSLFLTYSSLLSVRTLSQRLATDHFRDQLQALDLALPYAGCRYLIHFGHKFLELIGFCAK